MIRVVFDDLAFLQVDAVVRPADHTLEPVTPAMTRLDRAGGPAFAAQRRRQTHALEAGAAVVTGGGEITAPFVLHVVIQDDDAVGGPEVIRRALISAWQRAADWGLKSIAAPLVGAGVGRLTPEDAARLLVETFPQGPDACPADLSIVVELERDLEPVEAVVRGRPS